MGICKWARSFDVGTGSWSVDIVTALKRIEMGRKLTITERISHWRRMLSPERLGGVWFVHTLLREKVRAMIVYDGVAKVVGPKKEAGLTLLMWTLKRAQRYTKIKESHQETWENTKSDVVGFGLYGFTFTLWFRFHTFPTLPGISKLATLNAGSCRSSGGAGKGWSCEKLFISRQVPWYFMTCQLCSSGFEFTTTCHNNLNSTLMWQGSHKAPICPPFTCRSWASLMRRNGS